MSIATIGLQLTSEQTRCLDQYYRGGETLEQLAIEFECSVASVVRLRDSELGESYALKLVNATRSRINLAAARILDQRLAVGNGMGNETLVKLYAASLPKETPSDTYDKVVAEANRLQKKHNLTDDQRDRLIRISLGQERDDDLLDPFSGRDELVNQS